MGKEESPRGLAQSGWPDNIHNPIRHARWYPNAGMPMDLHSASFMILSIRELGQLSVGF